MATYFLVSDGEVYREFVGPHVLVFVLTCSETVEKQVCNFLNYVQSGQLSTGRLQSCFSVTSKDFSTKKKFLFNLQKFWKKNVFTSWVIECRLMNKLHFSLIQNKFTTSMVPNS